MGIALAGIAAIITILGGLLGLWWQIKKSVNGAAAEKATTEHRIQALEKRADAGSEERAKVMQMLGETAAGGAAVKGIVDVMETKIAGDKELLAERFSSMERRLSELERHRVS